MQRAVFLDRDGTMARDVNYCRRVEDFKLFPGTITGIQLLNQNGFKAIVITNQSGIARGFFDIEMLNRIHLKMESELKAGGAMIDALYFCPHHPDENCGCRKPKPAMALQAAREHDIDCTRSFVVGDRLMDIQLAKNIGCKAVMIDNERGMNEMKNAPIQPDFVAADLLDASMWIIKQQN